ncbi:hypothetical protein EVAR_27699_1 [Eumeta japonica]|uniref:Uncharacterized protein n=1 Tax=Eumeta variegata TaxID=151549 RepID=A0A4C1WMR7_EUMVA|nr:hypothetical protein EVAR_27699_1 [Eumeta japonica]
MRTNSLGVSPRAGLISGSHYLVPQVICSRSEWAGRDGCGRPPRRRRSPSAITSSHCVAISKLGHQRRRLN